MYDDPDYSRAARYVCAPPIRKTEDQRVLWAALRKGEIQTVSTDHCSFTLEQKDAGRGDFTRIPGGLPGVETRGELLYTFGVTTRKISLATMCRVLAENPAKLYGMFPRKGVLQDGADADIVVYEAAVVRGHGLDFPPIPRRTMCSGPRIWPAWPVIPPMRASPSGAASARCGSGAAWRWRTASFWPGLTGNISPGASAACNREMRKKAAV